MRKTIRQRRRFGIAPMSATDDNASTTAFPRFRRGGWENSLTDGNHLDVPLLEPPLDLVEVVSVKAVAIIVCGCDVGV